MTPDKLERALTLARFFDDGVAAPQWVRLPTMPDGIDGLVHTALDLAPNGGVAPLDMIIGLVLWCSSGEPGDEACMQSSVFGTRCKAYCESRAADNYNCNMGSLCQ